MYCKNCGKTLGAGDKFCSNCGAKVEEEFVPAFKQPDFTPQEFEEKKPRRKFTVETFNWDLDGYPTDHKKTEDINFNWDSVLEEKQRGGFPRETVKKEPLESRSSIWDMPETLGRTEPRRSQPEPMAPFSQEEPQDRVEPMEEEKSLEETIFADMGTLKTEEPTRVSMRSKVDKIDKFYTFNKKKEELQALLDQEYERINNGYGDEDTGFVTEPAPKHEEFDWTLPGDKGFGAEIAQAVQAVSEAAEVPEAHAAEPIEETVILDQALTDPLRYVGVVPPQTPIGYVVTEEEQRAQGRVRINPAPVFEEMASAEEPDQAAAPNLEKEETAPKADQFPPREEEPAEKKEEPRLTFGDVFGADDDDDVLEKPEKKGTVLKVIAVILCILLAAELVMIGIQHFAPDSAAAKAINKGYESILAMISGDEEPEEPSAAPIIEETSEITKLIHAKQGLGQNIASVTENEELLFEDGKNYGFDDFANSYTFVNKPWYTDDEGNSVSYGEEIIGTVIQYYSAWVDKINGKNDAVLDYVDDTAEVYGEIESLEGEEDVQYGINKLEIGEIRAGSSGFYIYVSAAKADSKTNKETIEKQIIYMEPVDRTMKIVDMKEL